MSYQKPQMPTQQSPLGSVIGVQQQQLQQQQSQAQSQQYPAQPTVNNIPNGPMQAYSTGLKQQYSPLQVHTNGLDNSRNVSPAMNQPLNAAYLPPTSTTIQRPNMFPTSNAAMPAPMVPLTSENQQIPAKTHTPQIPNTSLPSQSTTANYYQSAQNAKPGSHVNMPTTTPTPVSLNVDKVTSNLQNIHLNNGNGIQSPHNQMPASLSPQTPANRLTNGNSTHSPQLPPTTTMPGFTSMPPKSIATNVAPPFAVPPNSKQIPLAQFNGISGPGAIPNKYPTMNQPPTIQPPQSSLPPAQQTQFKNIAPLNSAIGKRPLYPAQQLQQQQPQQQQQQQQQLPPPQIPVNNAAYNQYYQPPPMPQAYPQTMQSTTYGNQAYTQQQQQQQQQQPQSYGNDVVQRGFDSMWGHNTIDLMQRRHILPTVPVESPKISLEHQFYESVNCSPDIFRCTLTKIPESNALLQKSRLPLGILIHPFRDLNNLPVIQCSTIVRCRSCRTYINPFVYFVDSKKWKCNLCFRINELPDEFQYDPVSKSYGDVTRRPEVKSSTIEFIAPSEYMLRPPQPAIYLFLLDVSMIAQQSGYLRCVCQSLAEHLDAMPGDVRTQIGFVAYNSAVHFYSLAEGFNQPHEITVVDIDDPFLPCPDNLLINLNECKELIKDLLTQLPTRFASSHDSNSALGAALQVAFKLMQQTGGRVTVFQTCLPNLGPGALQSRENPNERSAKEIQHLGPATDFYKRHALECSGQQIAVDLFLMNSQYSDLATISGISKFSGGCIHHFPLFNAAKPQQVDAFKRCFERYLTRKIGFESVMRIRCTRGLTIHTFHGNFFVRSTDLLSLPNVNPDAGYGMQISYEENLGESKTVCFQAALLYTSSKGERRIRVHTLCLPITNCLTDVMYSADAQAIIGLISKMAVDRSLQSSIADARDAFINASCDIFSAFHTAQNIKSMNSQLVAPMNLSLLPLYMLALLKHTAFRTGTSTRLDDRVFAMCELKTLPLDQLIRYIYPDLYHLDCLFSENNNETNTDNSNGERPDPPLLQLSAEHLKSRSLFLLDCGTMILLLVGSNLPSTILKNVFGVTHVNEIPDLCFELPNTRTTDCDNLHSFLEAINVEKPYPPPIQIIRDNSPYRSMFIEKLVDDRSESSLSYYEFLQHLRTQVK